MPKGGSADPGAGFSGSGGRAAAGEIGRAAADRAGGGRGTTPAERARGQAAAEQDRVVAQLVADKKDILSTFFSDPALAPENVFAKTIAPDVALIDSFQNRSPAEILSDDFQKNAINLGISTTGTLGVNAIDALFGTDFAKQLGFDLGPATFEDVHSPTPLDLGPLTSQPTFTPSTNDGGDRDRLIRALVTNPTTGNFLAGQSSLSAQALEQAKTGFRSDLGELFTGDAFGDIDEGIISSIIDERRGPSNQLIANAGARGNFNPQGGAAANRVLDEQEGPARQRIADVGEGIFSTAQQGINEVRDRASGEIDNFTLGGSFDLQPFTDERQGLIDTQLSTLGDDLRSGLGADPLFDPKTALQAGGSAQGLVSGAPSNQPLLDTIAQRQQQSSNTNRRGLRTSGNGAF